MHSHPSKKILWFVIGVIAVEGLLVFSHNSDDLFTKEAAAGPEIATGAGTEAPVFTKDPNTSTKKVAEIAPTDSVLSYLSQIGRSLAEGSQQIETPQATLSVPPPHYALSDLDRVATDPSSVSAYMVSVLIILESSATDVHDEGALAAINSWLESGSENDLRVIADIQKVELVRAQALSKIAVPENFADTHLDLLNGVYAAAQALGSIEKARTNPQEGFFAAATYANFKSKQAQAVVTLTQRYNQYASLASRDAHAE